MGPTLIPAILWTASGAIPFLLWATLVRMPRSGVGLALMMLMGLPCAAMGPLAFIIFTPTLIYAGWDEIKQSWEN